MMKNFFLKSHIHNVKGSLNFCLYDLLHEEVYQILPQGSVEVLKCNLLENGLAFETAGIVPCKMAMSSDEVSSNIKNRLDVIQLHLNGPIGPTCWEKGTGAPGDDAGMTDAVLDEILRQIDVGAYGHTPCSIERVQVYFSSITPAQQKKIAGLQSLKHIDLYPAGVDGAGLEDLASLDPRIRIFHEPTTDPHYKGAERKIGDRRIFGLRNDGKGERGVWFLLHDQDAYIRQRKRGQAPWDSRGHHGKAKEGRCS